MTEQPAIEPGIAEVYRRDDGTRVVVRADPVIQVDTELLASETLDHGVIEPDGTLCLDTAGQHRYRFVRVESDRAHIYERIASKIGEEPRPVADFWRNGGATPQPQHMPDWFDPAMQAYVDDFMAGRPLLPPAGAEVIEARDWDTIASSAIRNLFESSEAQPAPSWVTEPVRWDDLLDLYGQVDRPLVPRVIVADERTWNALRRAMPGEPGRPTLAPSPYGLPGIPVVVRREPQRRRPARRTGPLHGRRALHAGRIRVARLQRRVDRRAARRAPQPARGVFGVFR